MPISGMMRLLLLLMLVLTIPLRPAGAAGVADLRALQGLDSRVTDIGYRLATAAADLCGGGEPLAGLALHDAGQYDAAVRDTVRQAFGLDAGAMGVLAVARGGPAEAAGLRADDIIVAVDGEPLELPPVTRPATTRRRDAALDQLDRALADGSATLTVARGAERLTLRLTATRGCASRIEIVPGSGMNAGANGRTVSVDGRLANFVRDDDELAAIIAHEMAHNIRNHRHLLDSLGVKGGLLSVVGKNPARIRCTEVEADYVGIYLMARAGFDPAAATRFWDRFTSRGAPGFLRDPTHPPPADRQAHIARTMAEIEAKRAAGSPLTPDLDPTACQL